MRLDISEVLREVGAHVPYTLNVPPLVDEDIECTRPIEGVITFTNTGGNLLVRGKASTSIALPCSRCAEYFEYPVTLPIEEQFELRRTAGPRSSQTVEVIEEDESPIAGKLFEGQTFDLSELLRQYIMLDQPTRPLPPLTPEERCAQCHRRPEEVLQIASKSTEESEATINPAFAKLGELLNKKK